jgi:hypothetical protein
MSVVVGEKISFSADAGAAEARKASAARDAGADRSRLRIAFSEDSVEAAGFKPR